MTDQNPAQAAALELIAKFPGGRVLPLAGKIPSNPPCPNGLNDASSDPAVVQAWLQNGFNFGIHLESFGWLVLDVDGDQGWESLRGLEAKYGGLPETRVVLTGRHEVEDKSRGAHYYFRNPNNRIRSGALKDAHGDKIPGLDVKGSGGYVCGEGSRHASGFTYEFEASALESPADAPAWLLDRIEGRRAGIKADPRTATAQGGQGLILKGCRNDELFRTAFAWRTQYGQTEENVLAGLTATNNSICRPPLPEKEIQDIARKVCKQPATGYNPDDDVGADNDDDGNQSQFGTGYNASNAADPPNKPSTQGAPEQGTPEPQQAWPPEGWPPLLPLVDSFGPPFRVEALECAPVLAKWVPAIATQFQVDVGMGAMFGLAVVSSALLGKVSICPRRGWHEAPPIWSLALVPSGHLKTPVHGAAAGPVREWDRSRTRTRKERAAKNKVLRDMLTRETKRLHGQKPAPASGTPEFDELGAELTRIEEQLQEIPSDAPPEFWHDNIGVETLALVMSQNDGRALIASDEPTLLKIIMGLYNDGQSNFDFLLKCYDHGPAKARRGGYTAANQVAIHMPDPLIAMALAGQPGRLRDLAKNKDAEDFGLLARFTFILPPPVEIYSFEPPACPQDILDGYSQRVRLLLDTDAPGGMVYNLGLEPEAKDVFLEFRKTSRPRFTKPDGDLFELYSWGEKFAGRVLRYAAALHFARYGQSGFTQSIDAETMRAAITIGNWAAEHAKAAHELAGMAGGNVDAKRLLSWIRGERKTVFMRSEPMPACHFTKERLDKALQTLEFAGYIRCLANDTARRGKKPAERWQVRPGVQNEA